MDTTNPPLAGADDFDMFANDDEYATTEPSSAENTALSEPPLDMQMFFVLNADNMSLTS